MLICNPHTSFPGHFDRIARLRLATRCLGLAADARFGIGARREGCVRVCCGGAGWWGRRRSEVCGGCTWVCVSVSVSVRVSVYGWMEGVYKTLISALRIVVPYQFGSLHYFTPLHPSIQQHVEFQRPLPLRRDRVDSAVGEGSAGAYSVVRIVHPAPSRGVSLTSPAVALRASRRASLGYLGVSLELCSSAFGAIALNPTNTPSHCDTCKQLSGSTFTLNQIVPAKALDVTKGGDALGKYTYKGDSGKYKYTHPPIFPPYHPINPPQENPSTATTAPTAPRTSTTHKKRWAPTSSCCARACWSRGSARSSLRRRFTARRGCRGRRRWRGGLRLCRRSRGGGGG